MKKYYMIFLAAAFMSCQKEPAQEPQTENEVQEELCDVRIEAGIQTRTVLDGTDVMWEPGDELALVFNHAEEAPHVNRTMVNADAEQVSARAVFSGRIPVSVCVENGYQEIGYAVYPEDAVTDEGAYVHNLPAVQEMTSDGSFPSGCNLASAPLSLSDLREDGTASAEFVSAMSLLRLNLTSDIETVTLTGTAPLAGVAPLKMCDGSLEVDADGVWSEESLSVTLRPAEDEQFESKAYNVLIWPGKQEGLTIKVTFKNLGEYQKVSSVSPQKPVIFKPAKYYDLNFNNTEELIVTELEGCLDDLQNGTPDLGDVEENVNALLAQIQSVTLMTEYLDNYVYASYSTFNNGVQKHDVALDYIVKPGSAAQALVDAYKADPTVLSGVLGYKTTTGFELAEQEPDVKDVVLSEIDGYGKVVTVYMDASGISKDFYEGKCGASLALQIESGESSLLSEFANLAPKAGNAIGGSYLKDVPVIPGARVVIPFNYALSDPDASYTLSVSGCENVDWATLNYNTDYRTANLTVSVNQSRAIESQKVTVALTVGSGDDAESVLHEFTFVDSGSRIDFADPGKVDYIGGDIVVNVITQNVSSYLLTSSGSGVSQAGNILTFSENAGSERTASVECQASIPGVSLNYYKSLVITQKAAGTSLSKTYYTNGQKVLLNQATASGCSNYFNIVILGDGYKKKDLAVGGKFERSARSAMDSFFAVEPYKTFKDRFNVYMVAYESAEEGTDIRSSGVSRNTYFNSYCQGGGNTAAYVDGTDKVVNAVKNAVGSSDAVYYRSIAVLLLNTDEQAGSTGYPFRDYKSGFANGYASFAIAVLAANSTGTNGLVKHEAGGHGFGRLADEYYSGSGAAGTSVKNDLASWQAKGWYWNVTSSGNYYKFTASAYSSSEVGFIEGAWGYAYGIYRPTAGGMMQGSTGVFNAPSRHAIYHRIITESEGVNAYSWSKFLNYDHKNR